MVILQQMVIFFIMMIVGYAVRRAKIVTPEIQPKLSQIVANVCGPCMIVTAAATATDRMSGDAVLAAFIVFAVLTALMLVIGRILPVILRYPKQQRGVVNMAFWLTNVGFIGLPLIQASYGAQAMIYLTFYLMMNNIILYSYGITCVGGHGGGNVRDTLRALANPGVAGCIIAVVVYFGNIPVPYVVVQPINLIGNMTAPLAMMLIGASLADLNAKHMLTNVRMVCFSLLSMIVLPIAIVLLFKQFVADANLLAVCMVVLGTPSGAMVGIFASIYNRDAYVMASEYIIFTTVMSVVSLPIVSLATGV